jgi:hypothetical protein
MEAVPVKVGTGQVLLCEQTVAQPGVLSHCSGPFRADGDARGGPMTGTIQSLM